MREHNNIQDELQDISPFLANLREKEDGFEVPNLYFDRLEQNIMAGIKAEEEAENWTTASSANPIETELTLTQKLKNWLFKPQFAMAFGLALVAIVAVTVFLQQPNDTIDGLAISEEEALEYIEDNIDQFSETIIMEAVGEDLAELEVSTDWEVNETELEEYIEENIIDDVDENLIDEIL